MSRILIIAGIVTIALAQQETENVLKSIQEKAAAFQLQQQQQRTPPNQKFSQAKALERSGLYEEAEALFRELNIEKPGVPQYFTPLKNLLRQQENWEDLLEFTKEYSEARINDFQAKLEYLDIYIWMDREKDWQKTCWQIVAEKSADLNIMKTVIQRLVGNSKYDFAHEVIVKLRGTTGKKDFYSLEMGTFFGMRMAFEKSIREYMVHLKYNPKRWQTISDRIMAFPDYTEVLNQTKTILDDSELPQAKFILADLQFKLKNYDEAYQTLLINDAPPQLILNFGRDLIMVAEYFRAEKVFTELLKSGARNQVITAAVFEIAKIFESRMTVETSRLPLSGFYGDNPFFTSPFLPIKENAGKSMWQAMDIYDSLRTSGNNSEAAFRLAEIRFRAMGDLDGALNVYRDVHRYGKNKKLKIDSGLRIADIFIAKGDLEGAEAELEKMKKQSANVLEFEIKSCQVLFYQGEFMAADEGLRAIAKTLKKGKAEYNNILEVMAVLIGFRHNQQEFKKFAEIQLNIQQNKRTEAMENLRPLFDTNEIFIADMCRFQYAYLNYLQGEIQAAGLMLSEIQNETIFKELAHIFQAEILDFVIKDASAAIDSYLEFLELYPMSIYYDDIRLRLRELTS